MGQMDSIEQIFEDLRKQLTISEGIISPYLIRAHQVVFAESTRQELDEAPAGELDYLSSRVNFLTGLVQTLEKEKASLESKLFHTAVERNNLETKLKDYITRSNSNTNYIPKATELELIYQQSRENELQRYIVCQNENSQPQQKEDYMGILGLGSADHVLILGEEDFSFTRVIMRFVRSKENILATTYRKHHDISKIQNDVITFTGVDATRLTETLPPGIKFDRIFFMFPWPTHYEHGNSIQELRTLLEKFFISSKQVLIGYGSMVCVSLYGKVQLNEVNIEQIAKDAGFSRCESHRFGTIWSRVLKPFNYRPYIPGAPVESIEELSMLYLFRL